MEAAYEFILLYGLWAVAVGAFFEGELTIITAGLLAGHNPEIFHISNVWLYALFGAWTGHLFWFYFGRYLKQTRMIGLIPGWKKNMRKVNRFVLKNPWTSVIFLQYAYGLRVLGAIAFGVTRVNIFWFVFIQAINCAIWAAIFSLLGLCLGESIRQDFVSVAKYIWISITILIILGVLIYRSRKKIKLLS